MLNAKCENGKSENLRKDKNLAIEIPEGLDFLVQDAFGEKLN